MELTTPKNFLSYLARGESAAKLQNENTCGKKKKEQTIWECYAHFMYKKETRIKIRVLWVKGKFMNSV